MKNPLLRLALAASAAALLSGSSRAQVVAAKNPCADASSLQTRADILAAVPADDPKWQEALRQRGIYKDGDSWMQQFNGGKASASNPAFVAAFGDYCAARAAAATAGKSTVAAKSNLPAWAVAANAANEKNLRQRFMDETARSKTRAAAAASASSGTALPAAPPDPVAEDPCPGICSQVLTCRDAGIVGDNTPTGFRCSKASHDAAADKCTCS